MTNSPFDDLERPVWEKGFRRDERFVAALRVDPLLLAWNDTARRLAGSGYKVGAGFSGQTIGEVRRFLTDWTKRIQAKYLMVSLPPDFRYPAANPCAQLMEMAVLPHCREFGLPLALMLGVKRAVNPALRLAGDGVGAADLQSLQNLCAGFSENKFLVTALPRESQHELCVLARKFRNLHVFGCWWFTNVPHVVEEMTRMRLELIGLSVTPQHSDARVLEQVIYKWNNTRRTLARVLSNTYRLLSEDGRGVTRGDIQRDVTRLFRSNAEAWMDLRTPASDAPAQSL